MDHTSGAPSRAGRPVDVAGGGRFHPTQAGTGGRCGPKAALGETLRHRPSDTGPGPPRGFAAFSGTRHTRQAAKTLRSLTGTAQRAPLGPSQALPGRQEDRLNPHEDSERGSFARDISPSQNSSCLKRKLSYPRSLLRPMLPTIVSVVQMNELKQELFAQVLRR